MKIFLQILLGFLVISTLNAKPGYFIGLCVLTAVVFLTLGLMTIFSDSAPPYRHYLKFAETLEKGQLDENEFIQKVGENTRWSASDQREEHELSVSQTAALERLIYDGKIIKRVGKLSLP